MVLLSNLSDTLSDGLSVTLSQSGDEGLRLLFIRHGLLSDLDIAEPAQWEYLNEESYTRIKS